jgi:glycosyltransferase 2 family protein
LKFNTKLLIQTVKTIFVFAVILFITLYLFHNRDIILSLNLEVNGKLLVSSFILLVFYPFFNVIIWYYITKRNKCEISFNKTVVLRLYSELGKYIPGKLWGYGMLIIYYGKEGISKKDISICSFFELLASTLGSILIFIVSLIFIENSLIQSYRFIAIILLILFFIAIHPKIIEFFSNKVLVLLKKDRISIKLTYTFIFKLVILYSANWMFFGFAFFVFIHSFYNLSSNYYFFITGSLSLSSLIGFFTFFAPAGIGVRESILILTLKNILSIEIATIISITSRIWVTIAELIVILLTIIYDKTKKIL